MKPTKSKKRPAVPDQVPGDPPSEELGGTDIDAESSREQGMEPEPGGGALDGDEGSGGSYGRPRSDDEDERA
jgi:hypothetical protein